MADKSTGAAASHRWWQLIAGIICMVMIANLQYGWTLFVRPMNVAHGWVVADIQIAFSIFIALETWLTPIEGWLADKIGPKFVVATAVMNFVVVALALFVLKPLRSKRIARLAQRAPAE